MIVDSIIKSLVEKHPDLLNSFEGGNWDDFLNGVYPDDIEIIVLRNLVEYAHFNKYLPEDVVLLKKENFYTLGENFLDGEQGYEVPLLEGEERIVDETVVSKRSKSPKNKKNKKKKNKLYYLLYFLIFLSVVILGIFLALNGSTAQEAPQKDISQLPRKTEKKVENQNKGSESKKEESDKKTETTSSEPKKEVLNQLILNLEIQQIHQTEETAHLQTKKQVQLRLQHNQVIIHKRQAQQRSLLKLPRKKKQLLKNLQ